VFDVVRGFGDVEVMRRHSYEHTIMC
jgi:hypothetical protein